MTYENDPRRPMPRASGPNINNRYSGMAWRVLAVFALLVVAGFMFYNSGGHGPQTASNTAPSTSPPATAPVPAPPTKTP
jgi:hypothetical protein